MENLFQRFLVVFIPLLCSTPAQYSYTINPRRAWLIISIVIPIGLFAGGIATQNLLTLLFGTSSFAVLIVSWLHREHTIKLSSAGDIAVGMGLIPTVFLGIELGDLSKEFLLQMYGGIFQACLATLGILFAVAVFSNDALQKPDANLLKSMLYNLGKYLGIITIISLIGLVYSNHQFRFGYSVFASPEFPLGIISPIWNLPTFQILIFFFSLQMVFSLVGYLIVLLKIILAVKTKK